MVDFNILVESVLLNEADVSVPTWFQEILNRHEYLFGPKITDEDLSDFFDLLDDTKISEIEGLKDYSKLRILDLMKTYYDSMDPKPKDINEFKQNITDNSDIFENKINNLKNLNDQNKFNWKLTNPKIIDLKTRSEKVAGQRGADTLMSEYGNDFIIPAVQKIVKKRIDFFTRVANLKSPKTPFTNLITDVFKYPLQYKSGTKKYTSDFEEVDKFYIDNLIDIAVAAQNFYTSEMTQLKTRQTISQEKLNLFNLMVGDILNEISSAVNRTVYPQSNAGDWNTKSITQQSQTPTRQIIPKEVVNTIKQELLSEPQIQNKINFYLGKPINYTLVDVEGKLKQDTPEQTDPQNYKINQLQKNPRAKNLIDLLNQVAAYSKKKPGAGQRLQQLGQLGSNIAAAAGAKLYG